MKQLRRFCIACGIISFAIFLLYSCQKDESSDNAVPEGQQRVSIRLSDNPINFDAVNVDIQRVEVLVLADSCGNNNNRDCLVVDTLEIRAGVYNLINLSNGADTLLASDFTVQGQIKELRLILGTQNSVVIDSVSYPLSLWNDENEVTIQVKGGEIEEISADDLQIWLDFDAGRSIVRVRNNEFVLKPVIRIWLPAQTASIEGRVIPREAEAVVSAMADGDTLVAIPDRRDGRFKIRGLKGETADILINATANGYRDTTITGVPLQRGRETDIGTIELHN